MNAPARERLRSRCCRSCSGREIRREEEEEEEEEKEDEEEVA
jgi:hypothetical protein